jgi:hypothetical protein
MSLAERPLSDEDKSMIRYFIQEKGDVTRWCDWEERKSQVEKEYPELIEVLNKIETYERLLKAVLETIA